MVWNVFDQSPLDSGLGLRPRPTAEAPSYRQTIEAISARHQVPVNVLAAIEEMGGGDPSSAAARAEETAAEIAREISGGAAIEDVLARRFGKDIGPRVMSRAYDIADELYPAERPEQPGAIGDAVRQIGGAVTRGAGSALKLASVATDTDAAGDGNMVSRGLDAASRWLGGKGAAMQAGVSDATAEAIRGSQISGDLFSPSTWSLGDNPSLRGLAMQGLDVFGSMLPVVVTGAVTRSPAAAAAVGGAMGGGAGAETARDIILEMATTKGEDGRPLIESQSTVYREARDAGASHEEALRAAIAGAEQFAALLTTPISALGGAATQKILEPGAKALGAKAIAARVAGRAGLSALEEGSQEVAETMAARGGANVGAGSDVSITEGTFGDFLLGAMGGSVPGAASGAFSRREDNTEIPGDGRIDGETAAPLDAGFPVGAEGAVPDMAPPTVAEPAGPISDLASMAPAPAPEAPGLFPDQKPGNAVRVSTPDGLTVDAVFLAETPDGVTIRVGGDPIDLTRDEFDAATAAAKVADEAAKKAEKAADKAAAKSDAQTAPASPVAPAVEAAKLSEANASLSEKAEAAITPKPGATVQPITPEEAARRMEIIAAQAKVSGWNARLKRKHDDLARIANAGQPFDPETGEIIDPSQASAVPAAGDAPAQTRQTAPSPEREGAAPSPSEMSDLGKTDELDKMANLDTSESRGQKLPPETPVVVQELPSGEQQADLSDTGAQQNEPKKPADRTTGKTYRLDGVLSKPEATTLAKYRDTDGGELVAKIDEAARRAVTQLRERGQDIDAFDGLGRDAGGKFSQEAVLVREAEALARDLIHDIKKGKGEIAFPDRDEDTGDWIDDAKGDGVPSAAYQALQWLENFEAQGIITDASDLMDATPEPTGKMPAEEIFPPVKGTVSLVAQAERGGEMSLEDAAARVEEWKAAAKEIGKSGKNGDKVIVSLFDYTGAWSQPWEDAGYRVMRFDIKTGTDLLTSAWFWDRMQEVNGSVYGLLSACPCTTFAGSGARWWEDLHDKESPEAVKKVFGERALTSGAKSPLEYNLMLVQATRDAISAANPSAFHVLENPIGRIEKAAGMPKPLARFHPHNFGDPYTKFTQLFGQFSTDLPFANVEPVDGSKMQSQHRGDDPLGKEARSTTPEGFSYAFFVANDPDARKMIAETQKADAPAQASRKAPRQDGEKNPAPPKAAEKPQPAPARDRPPLEIKPAGAPAVQPDMLGAEVKTEAQLADADRRKREWGQYLAIAEAASSTWDGNLEAATAYINKRTITLTGSKGSRTTDTEGMSRSDISGWTRWALKQIGGFAQHTAQPEDGRRNSFGPNLSDTVPTAKDVRTAAKEADRSPTDAQKEAGNYKMGHIQWNGLDITIENAKGSTRSGKDQDGETWSVKMPAHYGYIKRTRGADGDHLDVYLGDSPESDYVLVVDQVNAETGEFDEHKIVLGTQARAEAQSLYVAGFSDGKGAQRIGGVTEMTVEKFLNFVMNNTWEKPISLHGKNPGEPQKYHAGFSDRFAGKPRQLPSYYNLGPRTAGAAAYFRGWDEANRNKMAPKLKGEQEAKSAASVNDNRPKDGWTPIGNNGRGKPLFQDGKGVRSYTDGGIRITETVGIVPGGGITINTDRRGKDFSTEAELMPNAEATVSAPQEIVPDEKPQEASNSQPKPKSALGELSQGKQDRAALLRARIAERMRTQLNAGLDPELLKDAVELVGIYIEAGLRKFRKMLDQVAADMGLTAKEIEPWARAAYNQARDDMELEGQDVADMDDAKAVLAEVKSLRAEDSKSPASSAISGEEPKGNIDGQPAGSRADREDSEGGKRQADRGGRVGAGEPDGGGGQGDLAAEPAATPRADDGTRGAGRSGARHGDADAQPEARSGEGGMEPAGRDDASLRRSDDAGRLTPKARPNYRITDPESLIGGSPKRRFAKNRAAIEAFQKITDENREPAPEELDALAAYIGWGSFGQELFQGTWERAIYKDGWKDENDWLRGHLGKEEWQSAQKSIINAHYTDPPTVQAMWRMVERLGFKGGRILEPSMGIGNFFGMMPANIAANSDLTGIELDKLTGGMAKLLYPRAAVRIQGYEESKTADNFYDLVIGNWPFENNEVPDRRYMKLKPNLHDYFFVKALDQVRPGGLVIGITSAGTMDKQSRVIRQHLAKNAELVDSFRLPSGAFEKYAGTKVVTDIIILKKRETPLLDVSETGWVNTQEVDTPQGTAVRVNQLYATYPQNVLGTINFGSSSTYGRASMIVDRPADILDRLENLHTRLNAGTYQPITRGSEPRFISNNTKDPQFSVIDDGGKLYRVNGERMEVLEDILSYKVKDAKKTAEREAEIRGLTDLRRKLGAVLDADRDGKPDAEAKRDALKKAYQAFRKAHGPIVDSYGLTALTKVKDPGAALVASLETADGKPASIMEAATTRAARAIENPTINDAFVIARNESTVLDLDRIAALAKKPVAEVTQKLLDDRAIYRTPGGGIEASDVFLSGNVRQKLKDAIAAKAEGADMDASIAALKEVVPADVPYFNIEAKFGAMWIPGDVYTDFLLERFALGEGRRKEATVRYSAGAWHVEFPKGFDNRADVQKITGGEMGAKSFVSHAINNKTITIWGKDENGSKVKLQEASEKANEAAATFRGEFSDWVWKDPERRSNLEVAYNDAMNAVATPRYDGSFLDFAGMALTRGDQPFNLRSHQANAIWRGILNGRGLYAHEVGTGKTITMAGIAVESRRYGLARKPLLVAHNANSRSVFNEIQEVYPGGKFLYVDNLAPDDIATTLRRIATDDWDAIVIPHSLLDRMALREDTLMAMAADEIAAYESEALEAAKEDGVNLTIEDMDDEDAIKKLRSVTAKQLVKTRNQIVTRIKKQALQASKENAITFEDLGIDMVMVDEGHEFKKPPVATRMTVKGLQTQVSSRALQLRFLTDYVKGQRGGKGVHVFTGTPITNTITEIFHQMRYVMEDVMRESDVADWDGFFNTFAASIPDVERTAAGDYESVERLSSFVNVAELRRMAGQFMDIVFADDMPEFKPRTTDSGKTLKDAGLTDAERDFLMNGRTENAVGRPYKKVIHDIAPMDPVQEGIMSEVVSYARAFRAASGKERMEIMRGGGPDAPIVFNAVPTRAGLDVRLHDIHAPDHPDSKANRAVRNIARIYKEDKRTAQVVFMDEGYSDSVTRVKKNAEGDVTSREKIQKFNLAKDIVRKLEAQGIPASEIAIVDGSVSKERRAQIAADVKKLKVRVVIGQTSTLGVGVNMQDNLRAMHHLDAPWMPGDLEQRNGRGQRQGNKWNTVLEFRYLTEGLDGRRWQVLTIKDRFIKAFLKADEDLRVIEGDATDDATSMDADDLAKTLSEAIGDPRVFQIKKLEKDIERLQRRERLHVEGIADAKRSIKRLSEAVPRDQKQLESYRAASDRYAAARDAGFTATIDGMTFDDRGEAQAAVDKAYLALSGTSSRDWFKTGMTVQGFPILAQRGWDGDFHLRPEFEGSNNYDTMGKPSIASAEAFLRNLAGKADAVAERIEQDKATVSRLEVAITQPFQQEAQLAGKKQQLAAVQKDLQDNPVAAPSWLRQGAPVDSLIYVDGNPRAVIGHRYTAAGWFVSTAEGDVDYLDAKDETGVALYEERPFEAPKIEEGTKLKTGDEGEREMRLADRWRTALVNLLQNPGRQFPELVVGSVGPVLSRVGVPNGTIYMAGSKIRKVIADHPEAREALMRLPELLANPDAIIEQRRTDSDFRIVTSAVSASGQPIIANLKVEGSTAAGKPGRVIMTVYGWTDATRGMQNALKANRVKYVRDTVTARRLGLGGEAPLETDKASVRSGDGSKILTRDDVIKGAGGDPHGEKVADGWQYIDAEAPITDADLESIAARVGAEMAAHNLAGKVEASVVRELYSTTTGAPIQGVFRGGAIKVRAGAAAGEVGTLHHEIIHVLRSAKLWRKPHGLFSEAEWRALVVEANRDPALIERVSALYPNLNGAQLDEEFVAELYRLWRDGGDAAKGSTAQRALTKIRDFFKAVANGLRGQGFFTAASVMRSIASGEVGARADAPARTGSTGPDAELRFDLTSAAGKARGMLGSRNWRKPNAEFFSDLLTDAMAGRASTLSVVPGRALFSELGKPLHAARAYQRHKEEMDALRNEWHSRADDTAQKWLTLRNKDQKTNDRFMDLMHRTTLAGVDPSQPETWKHPMEKSAREAISRLGESDPNARWAVGVMEQVRKRAAARQTLAAEFEALPPEFQSLYRELLDRYNRMGDDFERAVIENIKNANRIAVKRAEREHRKELRRIEDEGLTGEERQTAIEEADDRLRKIKQRGGWGMNARVSLLRSQFEKNKLKGPYFPLARFGKYFVTVRDADGRVVSFSKFETRGEQKRFAAEAEQENPGRITMGVIGDAKALRDQVDPGFVADVQQMLGEFGADNALMDAVWQRWLETLPDQSIRTSRIHRKGTKGYSADAYRAFGHHMFHGAHQLARLKFSLTMEESLNDAEEEAQVSADPVRLGLVVDEMRKRHEFTMNPTGGPLAAKLGGIGFIWYLGATPAAALVNLTQTTVVGIPIFNAHFKKASVGQIAKALGRASKDFVGGKMHTENAPTLSADEKAAMKEAIRRGTIDKTQAHDLASVAETGIEYSAVRERVMSKIAFFFHHAERFNREVTFLAAYRLARANGDLHEDAIETAADLTWKTHFDYQNTSRPRVMQNDTMKILTQFRAFTVNMLWRLFRDTHQAFKGASPEVRAEARAQLIGITLSLMAHAGIRGTWGYGLLMMLLGVFFPGGSDDAEEWLQDALLMEGDDMGVAAWNYMMGAALNGAPGQVLGVDLRDRIGMPNLWFRSPSRDLEGEDLYNHWVGELLGPIAGLGESWFRGTQMLAEGDLWRGTETVLPKFARDVLKAGRYAAEGVETRGGDTILESVNPLQVLAQASGFTPAQISERYEINNRLMNDERRILDERKGIHRAATDAIVAGEQIPADVFERIRDFNARYPEYPITTKTIQQSLRSRKSMSERREFGVALNPKLNARLRADQPPAVYN